MFYRRTAVATLLVSLSLSACGENLLPTEAPGDPIATEAPHSEGQTELTPSQALAHAFARALAEEDVRERLLSDMRASKWTEHKLILQEYLELPNGQALLNAAAHASGKAVGRLQEIASSYPPLDFYVPVAKQRRSWNGSDRVMVATVLTPDATKALAFSPDGKGRSVTTPLVPGVDAFFVIHGAESKAYHEDRDLGPGSTIQEEDELTPDLKMYVEPCEGCGGSGVSPSTKATQLEIYFTDGAFNGAAEVYWETAPQSNPANTMKSVKVEGLDPCTPYSINVELYDEAASSSNPLEAQLYEDDSWLFGGSDDYEGTATITGTDGYISFDAFPTTASEWCVAFDEHRAAYSVTVW